MLLQPLVNNSVELLKSPGILKEQRMERSDGSGELVARSVRGRAKGKGGQLREKLIKVEDEGEEVR